MPLLLLTAEHAESGEKRVTARNLTALRKNLSPVSTDLDKNALNSNLFTNISRSNTSDAKVESVVIVEVPSGNFRTQNDESNSSSWYNFYLTYLLSESRLDKSEKPENAAHHALTETLRLYGKEQNTIYNGKHADSITIEK